MKILVSIARKNFTRKNCQQENDPQLEIMNEEKIRLTQYSEYSGCAAKLGPCVLTESLGDLTQASCEDLLVDFRHSEDAGAYRISDDVAVVQTVDFFPPVVDDPYSFGQIAAANSLSDIYAMGARPITALSIVCFPIHELDVSVLKAIAEGGMSKLREANCSLLGGHSIKDDSVKYGLAVTGLIHPSKLLLNNTPKLDEHLILTKPIGNGIINTAIRLGKADDTLIDEVTRSMAMLNKVASEIITGYPVSACTDVTGFGLAGHAFEMIQDTKIGIELDFNAIPVYPQTIEMAKDRLVPGGTKGNITYRIDNVRGGNELPQWILDIVFDPQTSGGLLFTVPQNVSALIVEQLNEKGIRSAVIGQTTADAGKLTISI